MQNPAIIKKWFAFKDKGKLTHELIPSIHDCFTEILPYINMGSTSDGKITVLTARNMAKTRKPKNMVPGKKKATKQEFCCNIKQVTILLYIDFVIHITIVPFHDIVCHYER
jgi:hypothetical protein